ncbi:hypothetical protein ZWY2020_058649, partial [Hordeum vulgare]
MGRSPWSLLQPCRPEGEITLPSLAAASLAKQPTPHHDGEAGRDLHAPANSATPAPIPPAPAVTPGLGAADPAPAPAEADLAGPAAAANGPRTRNIAAPGAAPVEAPALAAMPAGANGPATPTEPSTQPCVEPGSSPCPGRLSILQRPSLRQDSSPCAASTSTRALVPGRFASPPITLQRRRNCHVSSQPWTLGAFLSAATKQLDA